MTIRTTSPLLAAASACFLAGAALGAPLVESVQPGETAVLGDALAADDGIVFTNSFARTDVRTISDVFPQRTPKTLLAEADLSEWRVTSGHIKGLDYVDDDVLPFNVVRTSGAMDVQLQSRCGLFLRCLKIRLTQNGENVDVAYVYSRYVRADMSKADLGVNFDAIPLDGHGDASRAAVDCDAKYALANPPTDGAGSAFGLTRLTLEKTGAAGAFQVTAPVTPGGTLTVADNVSVSLGADALGDNLATNAFAVGGTLAFEDTDAAPTLTGPIANAVITGETADGEEWTASLSAIHPTLLIKNADLSQLKGFRDVAISGANTAAVFYVESDGKTATMQFQGFFTVYYTACCFIKMQQQGDDVLATMTKAVYVWDTDAYHAYQSSYFGQDFRFVTPSGTWNYYVTRATMVMERPKTYPLSPAGGAAGGQLAFGARKAEKTIAVDLPERLKDYANAKYVTRTLYDTQLCMLKGFTGVDTSGSTTADVFCVENDGAYATMQVHGFFPYNYTACCFVKMQQDGTNVLVRQTSARYYSEKVASAAKSAAFGKDFTTLSDTTAWGYDVKYMTLLFEKPYEIAFGALKLNATTWLRGMQLKDLRGFSNLDVAQPDLVQNGAFFFKNDGETATVQLQCKQGYYTGCCYLQMRQVDGDVEVKMVKSCYVMNADAPNQMLYFGQDFDLLDPSVVQTWGYYPRHGKFLFSGLYTSVQLSGRNEMTGASIAVGTNVSASVTASGALPANGTIDVTGTLTLDAAGAAVNNQTFLIRRGGKVVHGPYNNVVEPGRTYFIFEGGELALQSSWWTQQPDFGGCYANYFTFTGGGRVTGALKPMLLGYSDAYFTVSGGEPARWDCGGLLVGQLNKPSYGVWTLYVDVADVTGDAAADFISSGAFREWGDVGKTNVSQRACVRKRGAGTWRIDEASPLMTSCIVIENGTVALNANDALPLAGYADGGVELAGGTLALAAGTDNALAGLTLSKSSEINVGEGATLVVGDSAANVWTDGATLNFTGARGKQAVRFGEDRNGLTAAQLAAIRFNGQEMTLDKDGYLTRPLGTTLLVR